MVSIDQLKQLRLETGVSFAECKKALEEAEGNLEKAKGILKKRGQKLAEMKSARETSQGIIDVYLHPNRKVGVLLDLRCESDFVARSTDFQQLAHELSLQIAAMKPKYIRGENIPEDYLIGERQIYQEQLAGSNKPRKVIDDIVEGKLTKYKQEVSLLSQPWIKDDGKTIDDLVKEYIAKIGENIVIKGFTRYEI